MEQEKESLPERERNLEMKSHGGHLRSKLFKRFEGQPQRGDWIVC